MTRRDDVWALTAYYNPAGYASRRINYRKFRAHLDMPLLTVELSTSSHFELTPTDAEIIIQVTAKSVQWQKERLLNIGLARLPSNVSSVAWLDCDIIFANPNWINQVGEVLEDFPIMQCFSELIDLQKNALPDLSASANYAPSSYAVAYLMKNGLWSSDDFRPATGERLLRTRCWGLAWAGRREFLERHGFYDAMILGGGDRALAYAAFGHFDHFIHYTCLNKQRANHYMKWAGPFFNEVQGRVGLIEGRLFHLWHGAIEDRRWGKRDQELGALDFDPARDLELSETGVWEWSSACPQSVRDYVRNYFGLRFEDGRVSTLT
jgi:hypothetical protein